MIYVLFVSIVILFIVWQFHVLKKYQFNYDAIQIKKHLKHLIINNKKIIKYSDIKSAEIFKDEVQPSVWERALSKGAVWVYNTNIRLYMTDDTVEVIRCNSKSLVQKIITELKPYTNIINDVDDDNEYNKSISLSLLIGLIVIILMTIAKSLH